MSAQSPPDAWIERSPYDEDFPLNEPPAECNKCCEGMEPTESGNCTRCDSERQSKTKLSGDQHAAEDGKSDILGTAVTNLPAQNLSPEPIGLMPVLNEITRRFSV